MQFLLGMIAIFVLLTLLNFTRDFFTGEGKWGSKRDERQKKILRDAVSYSWGGLLWYGLFRLLAPLVIKYIMHSQLINESTFYLFQNGRDILLVGAISYFIGYAISYRKYS